MLYFWAVLSGILPAAILVFFIYLRDHYQREPLKWIFKAIWFGVMSCIPALVIEVLLPKWEVASLWAALYNSSILASFPEEMMKFLFFWLLVRGNPFFDERVDGIVYAACVGMGFAGLENVAYMLTNPEDLAFLAFTRAFFSVPGHFFYAVFMGFYYSIAVFGKKSERAFNMFLAIATPCFLHFVFDFALMSFDIDPVFDVIAGIIFILLTIFFWKYGQKRITVLLDYDKATIHKHKV